MALTDAQIEAIRETWSLLRPSYPNDTATSHAVATRLKHGYGTVYRIMRGGGTDADIEPPFPLSMNASPDPIAPDEMPSGFVKGESVLFGPNGETKLRWVKTENKLTEQWAREMATGLALDLPQIVVPAPAQDVPVREQLVIIPFGDPHMGLHSWKEETGADFDLKIAERDLCEAVQRLVDAVPASTECLIANLGDFFHADNMDGETWRNKNRLDTDTRWAKVLRVGVKAMRYCIEAAARKHGRVTVINAIGNHDDHTSIFLSVCLSHIYEQDERVHILDAPTATHYYRYHNNLIGVHHGHQIKMADLPLEMADARPDDWGATEHRLWLTGHIHHDSKKEIKGVVVESFRTLAARDAWAAGRGYRSGRDMKAIVLHPQWGEIERHTISVAMLDYARRMANEQG